jgi:hypothetical protein
MELCAEIRTRYPHIEENDVERIADKAKYIYYKRKFPHEATPEKSHPLSSYISIQDVLQIADELVERLGFNTATGYRENGISWSFDDAWISKFTQRLLTPRVRTISRRAK